MPPNAVFGSTDAAADGWSVVALAVIEFRLLGVIVGNVSGSFASLVSAASVAGLLSDFSLAVCDEVAASAWAVRGEALLPLTGNEPDNSRRISSGEMCGVVRRPGELRAVAVFGAVVELEVDAAGSREATRSPPFADELELAELFAVLRDVVLVFADVPALLAGPAGDLAAALFFCGNREPPKPGSSVSCIVAGSGGIDSAWLLFVAPLFDDVFELPFAGRDWFEDCFAFDERFPLFC
jgi:hypothetical protein